MSVKTFFEKVGDELKKLFGSTTWEQQAQSVISYVAPIAITIVGLVDPAATALASSVTSTVQSDLATVSAVVSGAQVAPGSTAVQTAASALGSVKTNLSGLLAAAEVKNSSKISEITAAVDGIIGEVEALLSHLPGVSPAA